VPEVGEAADEGVDLGFVVLDLSYGGGDGVAVGEGGEGGGLFFEGPSSGGDEDEDDEAHGDEDEATGEGRARGLGRGSLIFGHGGRLGGEGNF